MDISILINNIRLNIRVAVIIETKNGYIFEHFINEKFYCIVGGRVQVNETSENAAKREVKEELGLNIENIKLKAIMESYFELNNEKFHEICFYYNYKLNENIKLPDNFYIFSIEEMKTVNFQPKIILDILSSKNDEIMHIVIHG